MHRHLNVIIRHDYDEDGDNNNVLYLLSKLPLSLTSMMEVTFISNESIILSTGRHVKGNEGETGRGMGESCNNKWRSISPTLLKTVGHVLTTRRWASHDA
jgi:hypothetical protein